jgi:hypothetical protein
MRDDEAMNLKIKAYALPDGSTINLDGPDDKPYWTVTHYSNRLSHDGTWDYEPLPSSRTEEWIRNHSFDSVEEAYECFMRAEDA